MPFVRAASRLFAHCFVMRSSRTFSLKASSRLPAIWTLQITLNEVAPVVSRTIRVDCTTRLRELHEIIQTVMGWQAVHRYEFDGGLSPDLPMNTAYRLGQQFEYIYDFGDYWVHTVSIAPTSAPRRAGIIYPVCIEGHRACPPEDCGGPLGYAELKHLLRSYSGRPLRVPLDDDFDPGVFDRAAVNAELRRLFAT